MKLILTIFISAILIQEVVPGTLVRFRRNANNSSSYLHTEYVAHIEQTGKNGNESYGKVSGKQAIQRDNCNDDWNAFANKCAELIKDLVASLANAVSSKPGDATNLQLHIKNTFRHFDKTHNCSCLDDSGKGLSDIDLSHIFDNLTLSTAGPPVDNDDQGNSNNDSGDNDNLSPASGINKHSQKLADGSSVNPEDEGDPNSTSNNRRHTNNEPYELHTGNTDETSETTDNNNSLASGSSHSVGNSPNEDSGNGALNDDNDDESHDNGYATVIPVIANDGDSGNSNGNDGGDEGGSNGGYTTVVPIIAHDGDNSNGNDGGHNGGDNDGSTTVVPLIVNGDSNDNSDCDDHTTVVPVVAIDDANSSGIDGGHNGGNDDGNSNGNDGGHNGGDNDGSTTVVPLIVNDDSNDNSDCDDHTTIVPVVAVDNGNSNGNGGDDDGGDDDAFTTVVPLVVKGDGNGDGDCDDHTTIVPIIASDGGNGNDNGDESGGNEGNDESNPTVMGPAIVPESSGDSSTDDIGDEVLITPRPAISVTQVPVIENQEVDQPISGGNNSQNDGEDNDSTVSVAAVNSQDGGDNSDSGDKSGSGISTTITPVAIVPAKDGSGNGGSGTGGCGSGDCGNGNNGNDDQGNDTAVSEIPIIVQPTTFQTTSKEPTSSPVNTHQSPDFVSITTASTPQDSHEGTDNKQGNDDGEDYDDDCCSCESCTEEDEETDPKAVKQNVCRSLEEARKELKAIFDKIKKKLRCCRKGQQTITSNTSSVPS